MAIVEVLGFGAKTIEEARELAVSEAARLVKSTGRAHRAEFSRFCGTCKVTGVAPGFKRKKCPDCGGRGSIPIASE